MSEVSQRPTGEIRKVIRVVWKFVLIPLMILYCVVGLSKQYELRNMRDPLFSDPEWKMAKYLSSKNPFGHYEAAMRLISDEDRELLDGPTDLLPNEIGRVSASPSAQQIDRALANIQPAIAQIQAGAACSQSDYEFAYKKKSINTLFPEFAPLRALARIAAMDAKQKILNGKTDEGIDELLSVAEMGSGVKRSGTMIGGLVGYAIDSIAFNPLSQAMGNGELTAAEYRRISNGLEKSGRDSPPFKDILKGEYLFSRGCMIEMLSTDCNSSNDISWCDSDGWPLIYRLYVNIPGIRTRTINNYDHAWKSMFESCDQPYTKSSDLDIETLVTRTDLISRIFLPVFNKAREKDVENSTIRRGLRLEAVLEAYRLDHGQYPERLDQLTGSYMSQVPSDPFAGGKPFVYSRKGNKYLLYSIGMDFEDDGGKHVQPYWEISGSNRGDIVFAPGLNIWKKENDPH